MLAWSATPNLHTESARLPLFFPHFLGFLHHTYFWDSVRVLQWDFGWYIFEISRVEGIIPALETAHAFAVLDQLGMKPEDVSVICLSGRGDKDLGTYMNAMNEQ